MVLYGKVQLCAMQKLEIKDKIPRYKLDAVAPV